MSELASSGQLRMAFIRRALITVPVIVLLGFVVGALSNAGGSNIWYATLAKPDIQPPGWAFPVAWTLFYVLMGLALAIVLSARGSPWRGYAVVLFLLQLALNLAWSPVFFGLHKTVGAFVLIIAIFAVAALTTAIFWRVRPTAAWLMLPYLAWLCFAGLLNWETIRLNPGADHLVVEPTDAQIEIRR